jgi:outer membrane lipoprotein SlyB
VTTTAQRSITLTLVSHTNVGKTTLARTLLKRDVGEVRDAPHVTQVNEAFEMIQGADGAILRLWDTPGFGDSARLAKRLALLSNPIGWLLSTVWDRLTNRNLWVSQQIVRNIREDADVVLYLVNATEDPATAGYVEPEMRILGWVGKPVLVLLNQLGAPRAKAIEDAEVRKWQGYFANVDVVRGVLPLDAFARCWVQEDVLLACVGEILPAAQRDTFAGLRRAWVAEQRKVFAASMRVLAGQLTRAAQAKEAAEDRDMLGTFVAMGAALGLSKGVQRDLKKGEEEAIDRLGSVLAEDIRGTTNELIALHGLDGTAASVVLERVATQVNTERPVDENKATVIGGAVAGALSGLIADLAVGGLTFGGAAIGGAVAGAVGARLAARGLNKVRGVQATVLSWNDEFLVGLTRTALLRYLAVAHFGRGRGEYAEGEYPSHWRTAVDEAIAETDRPLREALKSARDLGAADALEAWLTECTQTLLARLYADARVA